MVSIVNKTVLYFKDAKRVGLKCSYQTNAQKLIIWHDESTSQPHCGYHLTVHTYVKSSRCTPSTYTILYISYVSIKLEKVKAHVIEKKEFGILTNSQVMLMMLGLGLYFENCWPGNDGYLPMFCVSLQRKGQT